MTSRTAQVADDSVKLFESTTRRTLTRTDASRQSQGTVLSRKQFLEELQLEKRRSDRSRAPLSLVVMKFAVGPSLDEDDLDDIVAELRFNKRETDVLGYLGNGVVAFLLPYSEEKAAETFSKLLVERMRLPVAKVDLAAYTTSRFDAVLRESLAGGENWLPVTHGGHQAKRWQRAAKRGIDIVGALSLLIVGAPFMALVALAVKLTSKGPVIFRQARIGRDGVPFQFYKFRSMRVDSNDSVHREYVAKLIAGQHQEINEGEADKPVYKLRSDPRITPIGRIIRKTSIDELPQLFNVLRGDMSLVGPRPPLQYEVEKYQSWHMRRLQEVKPGITGLWQVEGRSKTSFDEMVRLDLRYVRHWSLWLDAKILLKTIVVVLRRDGAD